MLILMGVQKNKKYLKGTSKRRIKSPKRIYTFDPAVLCVGDLLVHRLTVENVSKEII